jgi:hypothetical protein
VTGADQTRWPIAYFDALGLFNLQKAHLAACQSSSVRPRLESRMPEIGLFGSEGGGIEATRRSLPLYLLPIARSK